VSQTAGKTLRRGAVNTERSDRAGRAAHSRVASRRHSCSPGVRAGPRERAWRFLVCEDEGGVRDRLPVLSAWQERRKGQQEPDAARRSAAARASIDATHVSLPPRAITPPVRALDDATAWGRWRQLGAAATRERRGRGVRGGWVRGGRGRRGVPPTGPGAARMGRRAGNKVGGRRWRRVAPRASRRARRRYKAANGAAGAASVATASSSFAGRAVTSRGRINLKKVLRALAGVSDLRRQRETSATQRRTFPRPDWNAGGGGGRGDGGQGRAPPGGPPASTSYAAFGAAAQQPRGLPPQPRGGGGGFAPSGFGAPPLQGQRRPAPGPPSTSYAAFGGGGGGGAGLGQLHPPREPTRRPPPATTATSYAAFGAGRGAGGFAQPPAAVPAVAPVQSRSFAAFGAIAAGVPPPPSPMAPTPLGAFPASPFAAQQQGFGGGLGGAPSAVSSGDGIAGGSFGGGGFGGPPTQPVRWGGFSAPPPFPAVQGGGFGTAPAPLQATGPRPPARPLPPPAAAPPAAPPPAASGAAAPAPDANAAAARAERERQAWLAPHFEPGAVPEELPPVAVG